VPRVAHRHRALSAIDQPPRFGWSNTRMSTGSMAAPVPHPAASQPGAPAPRIRGLSVGGRIYALCLMLLLITGGVAFMGYSGLGELAGSLRQYIRVSAATVDAVDIGWEFTRVRRHMAMFAESGTPEEIRFFADHLKNANAALAGADERIVVQDRKVLIQEIIAQFRLFSRSVDDMVALRLRLTKAREGFDQAYGALGGAQMGETAEAAALRAALGVLRFRASLLAMSVSPAIAKGYEDWLPMIGTAMRNLDGGEAALRLKTTAQTVIDRAAELAEANANFRKGLEGPFSDLSNKLEDLLGTLIDKQQGFAGTLAAAAQDDAERTQYRMLAVALAGGLLGVAVAIFVVRGLIRPLKAMTGAMVRLSAGDASITVTGQLRGDEIGDMARALDVFRQNADKIVAMMNAETVTMEIGETITAASRNDLTVRVDLGNKSGFLRNIGQAINALLQVSNETLRDISQKTRQVAAAVSEASVAVGQVSSGAREQNGSVGQVTQALAESAKAIRMVSTSANAASEKGVMAAQLVERGQVSAEQLARIVETIAQNSRKISQITQVIAGIANRTHILSLNAAIEAARAGEHGKGFVVVAQEVGKLAESAAQNAQQITDIVEQATADAAQGRTASMAVKETMDAIASDVSQTSQMIRSIAVAMEEQQAMVTQIEGNVKDLRGIASGNAVAAEEITATMIQLSQLADEQRQKLDTFKIA
jgi:methyl-accepting chemotaxis protein